MKTLTAIERAMRQSQPRWYRVTVEVWPSCLLALVRRKIAGEWSTWDQVYTPGRDRRTLRAVLVARGYIRRGQRIRYERMKERVEAAAAAA